MFQPPQLPASSNLPTQTPQEPAPLGWAIFAGVTFALVRFAVSLLFILGDGEPTRAKGGGMSHAAVMERLAGMAASVGAGLIAGVMFWRLRFRPPTKSQGAGIGVNAAAGSYVSIALFVGIVAAIGGAFRGEGLEALDSAVTAVITSLVCGSGSSVITGIIVFPVLILWGVVLSAMHSMSTPDDTRK